MRIGAVPVPVNARYKARELSYVVDTPACHLILDPSSAAARRRGAAGACRVVVGLDSRVRAAPKA
jgi:acyl-CoA synthetase (AMP-forming)/AMP-acid ligase II